MFPSVFFHDLILRKASEEIRLWSRFLLIPADARTVFTLLAGVPLATVSLAKVRWTAVTRSAPIWRISMRPCE